jgi:hypothetical protein
MDIKRTFVQRAIKARLDRVVETEENYNKDEAVDVCLQSLRKAVRVCLNKSF